MDRGGGLTRLLCSCLRSALPQNTRRGQQPEVRHVPAPPRGQPGTRTYPPAQPALVRRQPGVGRSEGRGDALENAAHTSCCKWSIHHGASWLVRLSLSLLQTWRAVLSRA